MTGEVIARSKAEAVIHAPLASIDLTEWVFTLTDSEYQACSKNHIAASASVSPEGKRMSVRFVNSVEVRSTPDYLQVLQKRGVPLAKASEYAQQAPTAHNIEEAPLLAKDIERKATAGRWA